MSANTWRTAPLGQLLRRNEQIIPIDPTGEYREVTVRLWGKGVILRGVVPGSSIAADRRIQVSTNQFIISKIDARNGAMGLVPPELHGAVVSNDFPTFETNESFLLPEFLGWLSRTKPFVDECRRASEGTTNRVRLKEERFNAIEIRLPHVDEQRRIVDRIEFIAAKVDEAQVVRHRAASEIDLFRRTGFRTIIQSAQGEMVRLESVCSHIIDCLHSNPIYSDDGIPTLRSPDVGWGELLLTTSRKTSVEEFERRTRRGTLDPGDIVVVREGGGTGKAGIIEEGQRASLGQRVMQLRPNQDYVLPRFLLYQWLSPMIQQDQIAHRMKGSASPHLNIGAIRQFSFLLPPIEEQQRVIREIERLTGQVDAIRQAQTQTGTAMSALLPSILDRAFAGEL